MRHRGNDTPRRRWRAAVDEARHSDGRAHSLVDDLDNFEHPLPVTDARCDGVTYPDRRRRLRAGTVDLHMPRAAKCSRRCPGRSSAHGPKPTIHPSHVHETSVARVDSHGGRTPERPGRGAPRTATSGNSSEHSDGGPTSDVPPLRRDASQL